MPPPQNVRDRERTLICSDSFANCALIAEFISTPPRERKKSSKDFNTTCIYNIYRKPYSLLTPHYVLTPLTCHLILIAFNNLSDMMGISVTIQVEGQNRGNCMVGQYFLSLLIIQNKGGPKEKKKKIKNPKPKENSFIGCI